TSATYALASPFPDVSMRSVLPTLLIAATTFSPAQTVTQPGPGAPIMIHADRIVDGRGNVIVGGTVVVQGGKITRVDKAATGTATYDIKGMTLIPSLIDAHSLLTVY